MEGRKVAHHPLVEVGLVRVDRLRMLHRHQTLSPRTNTGTHLAEVVEPRKLLSTVAGKGPLTSVFPAGGKNGKHG